MDTLELLLKHFNFLPFISLQEAGTLWGHTEKTMKEKIDAGDIPLPYFTPDGKQKSVKLVRLKTVARILDQRATEAEREFEKLWT
ncbi:Pyocin activator protein PrtN [Roseovarius sp. THAF9]|uniref:pyocin activator PrtN family protein n=1 Tax=Roseovarius sp. THAF9 TaxID=2587847 RepID=UPI00126926C3|nr:pyocin activator PrtN family protein [Roseovarius sp. THAF9]QFT93582.1 Pyocin activator protein PrtN [Roseovarius sp. THAF9]